MVKKSITIDELALMIKGEFDVVNKRHDNLDKRLDKLEENERLILKRLEGMVYRTEFEQLEIRVAELENLLDFNARKH